jgi:acyl-CoA reductase-like NAD-dependent aldehyde dehydrogenase
MTLLQQTYTHTIDGVSVGSDATYPVINPGTEETFAQAPDCSPEQLDAAVRAAQRTMREWESSPVERRRVLLAAADVVEQHAEELARLTVLEQGKPLADARGEASFAPAVFRYYADVELPPAVVRDDASSYVTLAHRPVGPVAAIGVWNVPLSMVSVKLATHLAAGNTVVYKPSPFTPLMSLRFGELLREVIPAGVFSIVSGGGELGAQLVSHPSIRKISMTGSIATGKKIAAAAAASLKRVTLELGGNDAAIVLDDADPAQAAESLFWAAFKNCGQLCICAKRVYVPQSRLATFTEAFVELARGVRVDDGFAEGVGMGPLQNESQLHKVMNLVADAGARGARVLHGGNRIDRPGYFHEPTIVGGATSGMRLVDEEQFGPVMPIIAYSDLDEAVYQANDTEFGLGGSVWSADPERAYGVAQRIEAGMVWVNGHGRNAFPVEPFGGVKSSGLGRELGMAGYLGATESQSIHVLKPAGVGA